MRKDVIKSLIQMRQHEVPFKVIERDISLPIDRNKIITIPGVRRCGKSTMMEIAVNRLVAGGTDVKRVLWIGFDDERLLDMTSDSLDEVLQAYSELYPGISLADVHMFFDEIQLIEGWEYFVLRVYKSYCRNVYVCGSNATVLSTQLTSILRGYPLEQEVLPLSFREYCRFLAVPTDSYTHADRAALRAACNDYILASAFPEVVLTPSPIDRLKILHSYFETMLLRDLVEHYRLSNIPAVRYFTRRLMANLSKPTSVNKIYNEMKSAGVRVSKDDVYLWANYVCDIFLFIRIPRFERSLVREQRAAYKYYCIDGGLRTSVLMPQSNDEGKLLENSIFLELWRRRQPGDRITYYASTAAECDFVIMRGDSAVALIQVTWDMGDNDTRKREIKGILEAARATGCDSLTIITRDEQGTVRADNRTINITPAWQWLLPPY